MKKAWPWRRSRCGADDANPRYDWRTRHREWHERHRQRRHFVYNRLYRQIYLSFMAVVLLVGLLAAAAGWMAGDRGSRPMDANTRALLVRLLPADASAQTLTATLGEIASIMHGAVGLYSPQGEAIARAGKDMPPRLSPAQRGEASLVLPDGRLVIMEWGQRAHILFIVWLVICSLLIALATWPVARRLTRRIERLQQQADIWGEGRLSTRMEVDGCDEIAELAIRFNQAAERVEAMVSSQRAMLAAASHELRSPLARIRVALDLLDGDRPDLHAQVARDIAELDGLIGDLLLASRLADDAPRLQIGPVDLLGLAAEEGSRVGASASGEALCVQGDLRLLRHLLRNLLDNARRYAPGSAPEIEVIRRSDACVQLHVLDRGPGIPEAEREKIFEPFYRLAGSAERGEGTGYGLALVRRIASLHGGSVQHLPREGGGSCFELILPLEQPASA
jgi:signal transduction histidine kinase